jgi:hypothetical protein
MTQRLSILAASALLGALALPAVAQKAAPIPRRDHADVARQSTLRHEREIVATVEAVDAAKRQVTLKGPKGNVVPLTVGPDVRNLRRSRSGTRSASATPRPCR